MRGAGLSAHVRSSNVTVCREMSVTGETMADDGILEPRGSGLARINRATGETLADGHAPMQLRDPPAPARGRGADPPLDCTNQLPSNRVDSYAEAANVCRGVACTPELLNRLRCSV